jgi:hypothetical protein
MVTSLKQKLIAAPPDGFLNFFPVNGHIGYVSLGMARYPVKVTKLAVGYANVGSIDIPVNLPCYFSVGDSLPAQGIGHQHQIRERCIFKKKNSLFGGKPFFIKRLLIKAIQIHGINN